MLTKTQDKENTETVSDLTFGFLTWWTVHQGVYSVQKLNELGADLNLPTPILDFLTGAEPKSAWLKATNLGAKGYASKPDDPHTTARYLTRDVGPRQRAVIRETIDENQKLVGTEQIGLVGLDEDDLAITADIQNAADWQQRDLVKEIVSLIDYMQLDLETRTGSIDDAKVRAALLKWLHARHRVCVRNTGGVYYIPLTPATYDDVREEVIAVREWVKETGLGVLSVVKLTDDGATSIADIQEAAVQELLSGIDEVNKSLADYSQKQNMNAGSMAYSTKSQLDRLAKLREKATALEEALGDVLLKVQVNLDMTEKQARKLHREAAQEVQLAKSTRQSPRKTGKTGTAQDRAKHVEL